MFKRLSTLYGRALNYLMNRRIKSLVKLYKPLFTTPEDYENYIANQEKKKHFFHVPLSGDIALSDEGLYVLMNGEPTQQVWKRENWKDILKLKQKMAKIHEEMLPEKIKLAIENKELHEIYVGGPVKHPTTVVPT